MIQFIKTRQVKSPERNVDENAGIDVYIPDNTPEFREDFLAKNPGFEWGFYDGTAGIIYIKPHTDIIIPLGIRSKFSHGLALIANNKSGIATKTKLIFGASVIDESYQGEWHGHMINWSDDMQKVKCGQKIIQFIPHLISTDPIEVLDLTLEEFYTKTTSRGEGWQGSTGVK